MARSEARLQFGVFGGLKGLSLEAKVLYFAVLVEPNVNQAGAGPLRLGLWAKSTEIPLGAAEKALRELDEERFVIVDDETEEFLIRTFIRNDGVVNQPNVLWAAVRAAVLIRSPRLRGVLAKELRRLPPKRPDTITKAGRTFVHADPHATADEIDPDLPTASLEPFSNPSRTLPSENPSRTLREPHSNPQGIGDRGGGVVTTPGTCDVDGDFLSQTAARTDDDETVPEPNAADDDADDDGLSDEPPRDDVEQVCTRLRDRIIANGFRPVPNITQAWRRDAAWMLDRDRRPLDQTLRLIDWACQDSFWAPNIRSPRKLRAQYDVLLAKARSERDKRTAPRKPNADDKIRALRAMTEQLDSALDSAARELPSAKKEQK
jgi:hypothetical protein